MSAVQEVSSVLPVASAMLSACCHSSLVTYASRTIWPSKLFLLYICSVHFLDCSALTQEDKSSSLGVAPVYMRYQSISTALLQQDQIYSNKATPQNSASPFVVPFFQTTTHPDCSFPFLHSYLLSPLDLELLCFPSGKSRSKRDTKWIRHNKIQLRLGTSPRIEAEERNPV